LPPLAPSNKNQELYGTGGLHPPAVGECGVRIHMKGKIVSYIGLLRWTFQSPCARAQIVSPEFRFDDVEQLLS